MVLHAMSITPSLVLGLLFAAQAGLNMSGMRRMADAAAEEAPAAATDRERAKWRKRRWGPASREKGRGPVA